MSKVKCAQCNNSIYECMGSTKAGDFLEFLQGKRKGQDVRQLCGYCATFYAYLKTNWRWLMKFAWTPIPTVYLCKKITKYTGVIFIEKP